MSRIVELPTRWNLSLVGLDGGTSPGQALAVCPDGRPVVAWTQGAGERSRAMLSHRAPSSAGPEWVSREVHPGAVESGECALTADPQGPLHLCWTARSTARGRRWLLYARSDDGGVSWSQPEVVQDPRAAGSAGAPQVAVDETGRLHLAWQTQNPGQSGQVWYASRRPGQGFEAAQPLGQGSGGARSPRFSAVGQGVAVAWLDRRDAPPGSAAEELYLGRVLGLGEVWDQRVSFSGDAQDGVCAEDRNGALHLSWQQRSNGDICYLQSPDGGRSWHDGGGFPTARGLNAAPGREPALTLGHHPFREVLWLGWLQDGGRPGGAPEAVLLAVSPNGGAEWHPAGQLPQRGRGARLRGLSLRVGPDRLPRLVWTTATPGATDQVWLATGSL